MSGRLAARQVIVLAAAFSLVGGLAAQRAIIRSETPPSTSPTDRARSAMIGISGDSSAIAVNPATGETIYASKQA
jgi:hypothetical protein